MKTLNFIIEWLNIPLDGFGVSLIIITLLLAIFLPLKGSIVKYIILFGSCIITVLFLRPVLIQVNFYAWIGFIGLLVGNFIFPSMRENLKLNKQIRINRKNRLRENLLEWDRRKNKQDKGIFGYLYDEMLDEQISMDLKLWGKKSLD